MDTAGQELTLDSFLSWKLDALKDYLGRRGLAKDKSKQELAALAFAAHTMQLPIIPSANDSVKQNKLDYSQLLKIDINTEIQDPFTMYEGWLNEKEGIHHWPPIFLSDIIEHAGVANSNTSIHKFLQQYKLGKGQSFIDSGHVNEIFCHNISSSFPYCLLRSECVPSQHIKDDPHKLWICVEKTTGSIKTTYCSCTAGLGSPCVHVTAVLFRVETAHRLGVSACTSLPCTWTVPSSHPKAEPSKLKNLKVVKPVHKLTSGEKRELVSAEKSQFKPIPGEDGIFKQLTDAVRISLPNACILKGIDVPELEEVPADKLATDCPISPDKYMMVEMVAKGLEGPVDNPLSKEVVESINMATQGQHTNSMWHNVRQGRITSSNFYSVHCKLQHDRCDSVVKPLVSNIMGYTSINPNIKSLKYGREMEPTARDAYLSYIKCDHQNIVSTTCGIFIDPVRPYLAASPDLLVSCLCCGKGVAEFKCPLIPKCDICHGLCTCKLPSCLHFVNDKLVMKHNHAYFSQIQGQMAITGRLYCDFFVYTVNGHFYERVPFYDHYYKDLLSDLDRFFKCYIVQEFKTRNVQNSLKNEERDEPMDVDCYMKGKVYFCPICNNVIADTVSTYKDQSVMCDSCGLWFHFQCVKLTKATAKGMKSWLCTRCCT